MPPVDILPTGSPATPWAPSTTLKHATVPLGAVVAVWRWASFGRAWRRLSGTGARHFSTPMPGGGQTAPVA